ncbi:MAG TPA: hypothetical protein VMS55_06060 [Myxococcota bacterium]|nr:hypothetical protein [Myxococcota bacterium]
MPGSEIGRRVREVVLTAALAAAGPLGCVPLPLIVTPPVSGQVRDAETGQPVAGAIVVVRFDARYDDLLPDRDVIAHEERISAADGSFELGRSAHAGVSVWPLVRSEARVVGVIADGYRCAAPQIVGDGPVQVDLSRALDDDDRRDSCRPIGSRAADAPRYLAAWQALHPREESRARREEERELERVLAARRALGRGENCQGPVVDLALAPDGNHAAWMVSDGDAASVEVRPTDALSRRAAPVALSLERASRRLAWTARGELLLWEPAGELDRALSASRLSSQGSGTEVVWRKGEPAPPASPPEDARALPLEPTDLRDEGDARWLGRTFQLTRALDPDSGLPRESLRVATGPRESHAIELPGEACGPPGEFGQPQLRIAADTRTALDLRDTGDGCGVVAIDLETGAWSRIDGARGSRCNVERRLPMGQLRTALRGYLTDVEEAIEQAGGDPTAAFSLRIDEDGATTAGSQTYTGERVRVAVPRFPVRTPLRRIEVGVLGSGGTGRAPVPPSGIPNVEPL